MKYVSSKDRKEFMADLKRVYKAQTKEIAEEALAGLSEKWGKKYPVVIKSWHNNWERLSTYFAYTEPIRRLIYTTNAIEGYHRQLRKVTKNKGAFCSDMAFLKLVYLATKNIEKKWSFPLPHWGLTAQQLMIRFGARMPINLPLNLEARQGSMV
jgi:transposase-like protein